MSFTCYLCGFHRAEVMADKDDIRFGCFGRDKKILRCSVCDLVQLSPPWTDRELDELYKTYWQKEDFKGQKRKTKISRYLAGLIKKGDRVLEVGCGYGDNVRFLREMGFDVTGIDKDPSVCDGEHILNKDVRDWNPPEPVDVIYAIHLFEHMRNPKNFIEWMLANLKDGGRFILEMPNIDNPLLTIFRNEKFNQFYWYPYHLFFYNKKTIHGLFYNLNVKIKAVQEYGLVNHLRWLFLGRPTNGNPHIPIVDDLYKFCLTRMVGIGDTLIVTGHK